MCDYDKFVSTIVKRLTCSIPTCYKFAQFGLNAPTHCRTHVPENDMRFREFDVSENKTNIRKFADSHNVEQYDKVGVTEEYNSERKREEQSCQTHKKRNVIRKLDFSEININLQPKKKSKHFCKHTNCTTYASFGIEKRTFCKKHADPNTMKNVKKKQTCSHIGCTKRPSFGIEKRTFCKKHADPNTMKNVSKQTCSYIGCTKVPSYGFVGESPIYCRKHRELGQITRSNAKCYLCKSIAQYGTNMKAKRCEIHKSVRDMCYIEQYCKSCRLQYILNSNGMCEYCEPSSKEFEIKSLHKQYELFKFLDDIGLNGNSSDKIIDGGICGYERPDRIFECDTFVIILECDEEQHKSRECLCEQTRMINISQSYGGLPVYFIRWNPDNYKTVKSEVEINIDKRYECLGEFLKSILDKTYKLPQQGLCYVIYMYFDYWCGLENEHWNCLLKFDT